MNRICPKCREPAAVHEEAEPDVGIMVPLYACNECRIRFFWDYYKDELHLLDKHE
jgi:hypothetical protein